MTGTGRFALVLAALVVVLVGADSASACSCVPIEIEQALKRSDGAFNGRLLSVRPVEGTVDAKFRYRVGHVAKGPFRRGQVVTVWSANSDAVCGLTQGVGKLYGLFVQRAGERWTSGACAMVSPKRLRRATRDAAASACGYPQTQGG
jgi:hypothetical protein